MTKLSKSQIKKIEQDSKRIYEQLKADHGLKVVRDFFFNHGDSQDLANLLEVDVKELLAYGWDSSLDIFLASYGVPEMLSRIDQLCNYDRKTGLTKIK